METKTNDAHPTSHLNLRSDGFSIISSSSEYAGELLGHRTDICFEQVAQDNATVLDKVLSLFNASDHLSFPLAPEGDELKRSLFCYHNPTLLSMQMAFQHSDDSLEYQITLTPLLLANAPRMPSQRDGQLVIHRVSPLATLSTDHYQAHYHDGNNGSVTVKFRFNTHYGSKTVVCVRALRNGKMVAEAELLVEAPEGDVFIPVPKFVEPWEYKYDGGDELKLSFLTDASYEVLRVSSSAPIASLVTALHDGSVEQAKHWRLFYSRDAPLFQHNCIGDLPLLEFVQKLTRVHCSQSIGDQAPSFRWYLDEERLCIVRAKHVSDILIQYSTQDGEVKRWVAVPPLPSPEGEEHLLAVLSKHKTPLWAGCRVVGYSASEGDEMTLRSFADTPSVVVRVIDMDAHWETRIVHATEATLMGVLLPTHVSAYVSVYGQGICKVDREVSCKDVGVTWSASLGAAIIGNHGHHDNTAIDHECTWNTVWICSPPEHCFLVVIESEGGTEHHFHGWDTCTVLWFKLHINAKDGIALSKQRLLFGEVRLLDDQRTLGSYGVGEGAVLHLEVSSKSTDR